MRKKGFWVSMEWTSGGVRGTDGSDVRGTDDWGVRGTDGCSKLVNPESIHGTLRSFLDLPRIFGRILTSRGFQPYLDIIHNVVGFKSHPGERTPLHRNGMGPASPGWTKGMNHRTISVIFPAAGTYPQFFWTTGRLCNFLGRQGISAIFRAAGGAKGLRGWNTPLGVSCAGITPLGVVLRRNTPLGVSLAAGSPRWEWPCARTTRRGCPWQQDPPLGVSAQGPPRWGWFGAGKSSFVV
ncbi:hypothetical protein Taro_010568 [Colocasia esculenta]|uniref:Uncharacterized protein n=1 Tax=Colocasia esculenta TaxID=4460 RepID=A0A843U3X8_COLES|nr:hypothetical protein [Colocasia esculenta]